METIKDIQKPPMVVWLGDNLQHPVMSGDTYQRGHWANVNHPPHHYGPYVNLNQFLEDVEREAQACADEGLNFDSSFVDILRDKVEEIIGNKK